MPNNVFSTLTDYLSLIPGVDGSIGTEIDNEGLWSVKFKIDIQHELAWNVVQELGSVVNYLSLEERLPAVFYPVSPPPYMNGGPEEYLSWVIESKDKTFTPALMMQWLEGRLPQPVSDLDQWKEEE